VDTIEDRFRKAISRLTQKEPAVVVEPIDQDESGEEVEESTYHPDKSVAKLASTTYINFFQHPDAHPLVLDLILLQKYGPEWMLWEPETLRWRIPQDFKTSDVSDLNMEKIQAVKTLHFSDAPWQDWEVFLPCCMAVNGLFPDFEVLQAPSVQQCMVAIDIFNKIRQDVPWSEELKVFLGVAWRHEGMFCPTEPAGFVEVDMSDLAVDIDCEALKDRWVEVRKSGSAPTKETVEDEQLRRMLAAHEYLNANRDLFEQQVGQVLNV
jgi:hypothetical protein